MNKNSTEYLYYNLKLTNSNRIDITRANEILKNTDDYETSITSFKVPTENIPLFFWDQNIPSEKDKYTVSLKRNATESLEILQFIPNTVGTPIYNIQAIWGVNEFVDSINNALAQAYLNLPDKGLTTEPPFFVYNPVNNLLSLYVEKIYISESLEIYVNQNLFEKLLSFQNFYDATEINKTFKIIIKDNFINNTTYNGKDFVIMTQEYTSVNKWSTLNRIEFTSTQIPVTPELDTSESNKYTQTLIDYQVNEDLYNRNPIIYNGESSLQWHSLQSNIELRTINCIVRWVDSDENKYDIVVSNEPLSAKIIFRKK